jgi:hypothetical protein
MKFNVLIFICVHSTVNTTSIHPSTKLNTHIHSSSIKQFLILNSTEWKFWFGFLILRVIGVYTHFKTKDREY